MSVYAFCCLGENRVSVLIVESLDFREPSSDSARALVAPRANDRGGPGTFFFSSLLLSSLKFSDTKVYEPQIRAHAVETQTALHPEAVKSILLTARDEHVPTGVPRSYDTGVPRS